MTFVTDVISVTEGCAKTALRLVSWIVTQVRAALLCAGNPHWKATSGFARVTVPTVCTKKHIAALPLDP